MQSAQSEQHDELRER